MIRKSSTEFKIDTYDRKKGSYILNIVGGEVNDGQEIYALYPKPDGGYYNLGKLLVVSYPEYKLKVKIIPLFEGFSSDFSNVKSRLESIYKRVGIDCEVTEGDYFSYADPLLFEKGSGLLNAYNAKMKALNAAYAASHDVDASTSYIFILGYSGQGSDRNFSGFMPLNSQFGYVSRHDFRSVDKFCIAVAHELAHGRLSLRHPFDSSLGLEEGDVAENLMDYKDGTELAKWQWDVVHDPGIVVRVFERDKDAMKVNEDGFKVQEALRIIRFILTKDLDYQFGSLNVQAKDIQIGNNKYQKIEIKTVQGEDKGGNSENLISFENLNIILANKNETKNMRNFLYGIEENIYGKSTKIVKLNGEEITLNVIINRMEEITLKLLKEDKYDRLTYKQKIILNIPIVQWKLGYHYGAAFMYYWFNGKNRVRDVENDSDRNDIIKIDTQNFSELFQRSSFFQNHLNNAIKRVENGDLYNVPTSLKCLANIKRAIELGQNIDIRIPLDYKSPDRYSSNYANFLYSHVVKANSMIDLSNNTVIDDDFAYAIGSCAIQVSMEGRLEVLGRDVGHVIFSKLSYRLWDTFDFVGDQSLGNWNADVFDATKVSLVFTNVSIGNKDFRDFYQIYTGNATNNGKTPWDFDVVTKSNPLEVDLIGLRYNIDALGTIKPELIK